MRKTYSYKLTESQGSPQQSAQGCLEGFYQLPPPPPPPPPPDIPPPPEPPPALANAVPALVLKAPIEAASAAALNRTPPPWYQRSASFFVYMSTNFSAQAFSTPKIIAYGRNRSNVFGSFSGAFAQSMRSFSATERYSLNPSISSRAIAPCCVRLPIKYPKTVTMTPETMSAKFPNESSEPMTINAIPVST